MAQGAPTLLCGAALPLLLLQLLCCGALSATGSLVLQAGGGSIAIGLYNSAALAYGIVQGWFFAGLPPSPRRRSSTPPPQPSVTVTYTGFGSARGLCRIENATQRCAATDRATPLALDFAATEAVVLGPEDYAAYPDLQMYPVAATATVPVVNLPSAPNVTLSVPLLAQIFRGDVLFWDDWRIKALNPNFSGWGIPPAQRIRLVVRSDTSGATQVFKRALAVDPVFQVRIGTSPSPEWPNVTVIPRPGVDGIVAYVMTTPYTLGYTDLRSALAGNLSVPVLLKGTNSTVGASLRSIEYALLELGLSFGNNGDDPSHLTADLVNAAGPNAWPIVGYNYVVIRKNTLRPGATCDNVRATADFWYWFWTSDVASNVANTESYVLLPPVVRTTVWARFEGDLRCAGALVWQSPPNVAVPGRGTGLLRSFLGPVLELYNAENLGLTVTYDADSDSGATQDPNLLGAAFGAATEPDLAAPPDGVKLVLAGVALVAVSQLSVTLSGEVLAQILEGSIITWLDDAIVALNPAGIANASGGLLTDPTLRIQLLQGPVATSDEMVQQMQRYLPSYTGAAIRAAYAAANEDLLRYLVLAYPLSLAVTPLTGVLPSGLAVAPLRRTDGAVVAPSWQSVRACATPDVFDASNAAFRLWASPAAACYPLAATVHLRVRRSQCNPETDAVRTQAARFAAWLLTTAATPNALRAAALAPLLDATPSALAANELALRQISCNQTFASASGDTGVIVGITAGVGGALFAAALALAWRQRRGHRDNSAAPRDGTKPFCVLFTDIESSTHLWATLPATMAAALEVHHTMIRQLIQEHRLYEVKTIGDAFMCATPDPRRALAFAVDLQTRFFRHPWPDGPALTAAYLHRPGGGDPAATKVYVSTVDDGDEEDPVWNGLRVRIGVHFGLGDVKLDPVSHGYDYYGTVANVAARIESVCHGGQIGVSREVRDVVGGEVPGAAWTDLGPHLLRGMTQPVHLFQVLPAGPLARRTFPPLRLERAWEVAEDDASEAVSGISGSLTLQSFNPDLHPLVQHGDLTAEELRQQYGTVLAALQTLFATQTAQFVESALQAICARLKVKYHGSMGPGQALTLHGLVLRLLPGTATAFLSDVATDRASQEPPATSPCSPTPRAGPFHLPRPAAVRVQARAPS